MSKKSIKINNLRHARLHGFVNRKGDNEGQLFYLVEFGKNGDPDSYVTTGQGDEPVWDPIEKKVVNPEIFGLIYNFSGLFDGAYPFSKEMALHYQALGRFYGKNDFELVSVDEVQEYKAMITKTNKG
jgi:hypothetical protein